ncbi:MAG: pyridoxamine 5'-phosphate oxidase family protein [Deltaproteobacteria bacterium]|nr:pyridoxamine 5'-phosphate oxidase family protein [Deltaproteobacteria bacterium]
MDITPHWPAIKKVFGDALNTSLHYAVATVNSDGTPHLTPVGSLILRDNPSGFFFDEFLQTLAGNIKQNPRVCVLAVNSSRLFWYRSLWQGRFRQAPAIRLTGTVGDRRPATPAELEMFQRRLRPFRRLKGYKILWQNMSKVRDITFDGFRPVEAGAMSRGIW